jgi:hypothetical protein
LPLAETSKHNRKFHGRTKNAQTDIQFSTRGDRYLIQMRGPEADIIGKADSPPTKWKIIYADRKIRLYTATSTRDTDFSVTGENIFMIITKDKRKFRIYPNDITHASLSAIQKAMKEYNNFK